MVGIKVCLLSIFMLNFIIAYEVEEYPNVGTVLFSPSDLKKKGWDNIDLSLLEARQYFQELLPSATAFNPSDESYLQGLLGYFNEAYIAIKREAHNKVSENVMTAALSDAIGGYLKSYVLPGAKYGFYGGTVVENDAVNIFNLYNEILQYMESDGLGWRDPNVKVLEVTTHGIMARSQHTPRVRSMKNPCDQLVTYESPSAGLTVPVPLVTWTDELSTMILPLKNHSFVILDASDTSNALLKYYNTAKDCLHSNSPQDEQEFDKNLQSWLNEDIMPHLNDDHLYLALNSVLTMVNDTRGLCNKLLKKLQNGTNLFPVHLSKKVLILTVILLLELISFIPAVFFILCCRKKTNKRFSSTTSIGSDSCNIYSSITKDQRHDEESYSAKDDPTDIVTKVCKSEVQTQFPSGVYSRDEQFESNTVGTSPPSSLLYTTKHCSTEVFSMVNESNVIPVKSLRKQSSRAPSTTSPSTALSQFKSEQLISNKESNNSREYTLSLSKASVKSMTTVRELKASNTFTMIHDTDSPMVRENMFHDKPLKKKSSSQEKTLETRISFHEIENNLQKKASEKPISAQNSLIEEENYTQGKYIDRSHNSQSGIIEERSDIQNKSTEKSYSQDNIIIKNKSVPKCLGSSKEIYRQMSLNTGCNPNEDLRSAINQEIETQIAKAKSLFKERKENSNIGFEIKTNAKPYFEIQFRKPLTKITVGLKDDIERYKPSKIPQRSARDFAVFTRSEQQSQEAQDIKRKSLIPLPKKRAIVDDIFIHSNETQTKDRLNETL